MKLSERALLVQVHRGGWAGARVDREVSEEARRSRNAERGAGRFTKVLVHPRFFDCVNRPIGQADAIWKRLSLPWGAFGERIMSNMAHPQFAQEMYAQKLAIDIGKGELLRREGEIHAEALTRLAGMYDRTEYPSIEEIVAKFGVDVEVKPVPESGDFRTKLSNATVKAIMKDMEDREKERMDKANKAVFQRVFDVVETMTKTLKEYEPKCDTSKGKNFKNSLVDNVRSMANVLPVLNIGEDVRIDDLHHELLKDLTQVPPEVLKASDAERESAIEKADKLLARIGSYMA